MSKVLEVTGKLIIDYRARGDWCQLPYPNHPKGCPNYGKKHSCPPTSPKIEAWLGDYLSAWFIYVPFNLNEHATNLKLKYPHWSDRQARCCLYWQPKVNKELQGAVKDFWPYRPDDVSYCPEAMGVNVIKTAQLYGVPIQEKPTDIIYKIALVVIRRESVGKHAFGMHIGCKWK